MNECKHGLRSGCYYCHNKTTPKPGAAIKQLGQKKPGKTTRLADKMNDRMTQLSRRLKELRGE
jgi:hypothetical protein